MIPIEVLIEAFKATLDFAESTASKFDDGKYAEAITALYGQAPTYAELDAQVEVIKAATDIPTQEKLELLRAISVQKDAAREREIAIKRQCAEIVDNGMTKKGETVGRIVSTVLKALFTGGISLIPDAIGYFGKRDDDNDPDDDEGEANAA